MAQSLDTKVNGQHSDRRSYSGSKLLITFLVALILAAMCGYSQATLIKLEGIPVAYDPASNLYWYTDLSRFTRMNYQQQSNMVESIHVDGFSGFHFADASAAGLLIASISSASDIQMFMPTDLQFERVFWTGRTDEIVAIGPDSDLYRRVYYFSLPQTSSSDLILQMFSVNDLSMSLQSPDLAVSAWVVGNQDQVPVPEPGSLILLSAGMIGLMLLYRRNFKLRCRHPYTKGKKV